jgi:hypothetical protein
VQKEIISASHLYDKGYIKQIFPIIIDNSVTYQDPRIPLWMRTEYNLKCISRPTVATRRIIQQMRKISWDYHPKLKEREKIFVGRNDLIGFFEERMDSIDKQQPVCIIASGLRSIGRRSLLKRCLIKANIVDETYQPPIINLNSFESLEDFILKVYALGFSINIDTSNLLHKKIDDKISIAIQLVKDLQAAKEILFIIDNDCILTHDRTLANWFTKFLDELKGEIDTNRLTFALASSRKPLAKSLLSNEHIFSLEVDELEKTERLGLLKRYLAFEGIDLSDDDVKFFWGLQQGFPEQVFYTVALIKDLGLISAKKDASLITDFNSEKVIPMIARYESDDKARNFLYLLSEFEFISYDFIFEIVGLDVYYQKLLDDFLSSAICEYLGANRELIRLNDVIRDYISRNRFPILDEFRAKIDVHVRNFLKNYQPDDMEVSDFFYSMKRALMDGQSIDEKLLIPSHFLKTMRELYDVRRSYKVVIQLAERVLQNEKYIDEHLVREVRNLLCLSLARLRNPRFLQEVEKVDGALYDFLFGFYYRLTGQYARALKSLKACLKKRHHFPGAKRELVQVYLYLEDYETAKGIAKQNYEFDRSNPFHIQAYFNCLIRSGAKYKKEMEDLLRRLRQIKSKTAEEMHMRAQAELAAYCENNEELAIEFINGAIESSDDKIYPLLTKFEIAEKFGRLPDMRDALAKLEARIDSSSNFYQMLVKTKAINFAAHGQISEARSLVAEKLRNYPEDARRRILHRIEKYVKMP